MNRTTAGGAARSRPGRVANTKVDHMKTPAFLLLLPLLCCTLSAQESGVPIAAGSTPAAPDQTFVYEQKPVLNHQTLIEPEQARGIVERFKEAFPKLESPRFLIYINRDLVDTESGLKVIARTENTATTTSKNESDFKADPNFNAGESKGTSITAEGNVTIRGGVGNRNIPGKGSSAGESKTVTAENRYRRDTAPAASLADRQTVRDVERLFGRPLRMGGVTLTDQRTATQLIASRPFESLRTEGDQARKDREAISKVADVVLEILISSREITVVTVSGDRTQSVPDIQATAIRLKDSAIIGQAASSDITGNARYASRAANFDVREIAEATALALMEDILLTTE